jgi:hypothetical protein
VTVAGQTPAHEKITLSVEQVMVARPPEVAQVAAELIEQIAVVGELIVQARETLVKMRMRELLAHVPKWQMLTQRETERLERSVREALDEYPAAKWWELLWCLTIDAVRPRRKGRKPKWFGVDGLLFAAEVEARMARMGLERTSKKGLANGVAALRSASPARYGGYSEERLRKLYYDVLRHHGLLLHQSEKPAE